MRLVLPIFALILLLPSCKKFVQYHPDEVRPNQEEVNRKNIERINRLPQKDAFKFILTGDSQRFYDELDAFTNHVNSLDDISFVILNGDLVDFGLNREYNILLPKLQRLKIPFVAVMGNHDMLANGKAIFNRMFGPENFTFTYSGSTFICFNSNSRESSFDGTVPDINMLQREISDASHSSNLFFVSHVPPYSLDFDSTLEHRYADIVSQAPHARVSLHAHEHNYNASTPYEDGFPYVVVSAFNRRSYGLVTVSGTKVDVEQIFY